MNVHTHLHTSKESFKRKKSISIIEGDNGHLGVILEWLGKKVDIKPMKGAEFF